jgi:O-methyltransferase involved in polyketide biosynthesis
MKRKVFTDGNGSTAILVEGLGHYVPSKEVEELEERIAELKVQVYFLTNRVKDLEGAKVFAEKWEDERDAEIAAKTVDECIDIAHSKFSVTGITSTLQDYANQLRQAKGGE